MSRELKFRAYHPDSGMTIFTFNDLSVDTSDGTRRAAVGFTDGDIRYLSDLVVMQFIGLKDKDDVSICEGDVVEHKAAGRKYHVIFDKSGRFGCEYRGAAVPPDVADQWKVIGNIYENPELLGGGE